MLTSKKKIILSVIAICISVYVLTLKKIEVVAMGTGLTGIKESNITIKAPSSGYITDILVSQSTQVRENQPLLRYRNLNDEYHLEQIIDELEHSNKLLRQYKSERCFLVSSNFAEKSIDHLNYDCNPDASIYGAGGLYIMSFYEDYINEQMFLMSIVKEQHKKEKELLEKKNNLEKKKEALIKGKGETIRFYDLKSELADVNSSIINFAITKLEDNKKVKEKLNNFQIRRSERLLTLEEKINTLEINIIEKNYQKQLLTERKNKSEILSPVTGSILELAEDLSDDTYMQEGSLMFVLKKEGASQEVLAKFPSKYSHFLSIGKQVKIQINTPGFKEIFGGTIIDLSSDSIAQEKNPMEQRFYKVTIKPDENFLKISLNLGIDVQVFVVNDNINVLQFIFSVLPNKLNFEVW